MREEEAWDNTFYHYGLNEVQTQISIWMENNKKGGQRAGWVDHTTGEEKKKKKSGKGGLTEILKRKPLEVSSGSNKRQGKKKTIQARGGRHGHIEHHLGGRGGAERGCNYTNKNSQVTRRGKNRGFLSGATCGPLTGEGATGASSLKKLQAAKFTGSWKVTKADTWRERKGKRPGGGVVPIKLI